MGSPAKQETEGSQSSVTNPWAAQEGYLKQGFQAASDAMAQAQGAPKPTDFVSQFTPDQLGLFSSMLSAGGNANNLFNSSSNAGGALTSAGSNAVTSGLGALSGFNPTSTGQIVNDTAAFSNNPQVDAMVNAATRDATRAVSEQALPQVRRSAALSGNTNSSRTGVAEGIIARGLADNVADTSAAIRGGTYNTGLNAALSRAGSNDASRLGALTGLVSGGTGAVGTGVGANAGAVDQLGGLYNIANQGVAGQQQASQAGLNNQMAQYQFGTSSPFDALNQYWNIVGSNNWGGSSSGTSKSTTTSTPSTMSQIGQGVGILGSMMMMSDRRVKKDIKRIDTYPNGLPMYKFRFKDDPTNELHVGLMAQDVEQVFPSAVTEIDGIKHVNYNYALNMYRY